MLLIPISRPIRATTIGMLIATSEPKATTSTTTATRMPIPSLEGPAAAPGIAEAVVVLDLDSGVTGGLHSFLGGVELRNFHLLLAEGHGRKGGLAVLAHGRTARVVGVAHAADVRHCLELGDGLRNGGLHLGRGETFLGVEDNVGGVERLRGEPLLECVSRALRLGARQPEGLVGLTTDAPVEHEGGYRDQDPGSEYAPRVASGEVTDPVEQARHGRAFLG